MSFIHTNSSQSLLILKTVLILSILSLSRTNSVCPSSAYVSASDASSYASAICATAVAGTTYRIQGGASLYCSVGSPNVTPSDPKILTQALCITTTTTPGGSSSSTSDIPIKETLPPGCPANYIQATYDQALTYQNEICAVLGDWDIVALQAGGSIRGPGYNCAITQTETTTMGHIACVPLAYLGPVTTATITIVNANENVCSSCQSLITTAEASTYYTFIPAGTTARIAGGSSVQRTSTSTFTIIDHDLVSEASQICASLPRAGCPTSSYLTSSCTCEPCLTSCYTCSGPSNCDSCSAVTGFPFSYNLLCYNTCPSGTFQSSPTTCNDCSGSCSACSGNPNYCTSCSSLISTPFLYENKCFAQCPDGTFLSSPNICSSQLENNAVSSSGLPKVTKVFEKISNIGFTVTAAFSGAPMAIFTGLLFKLIGYIKYLDIAYPNNLEQAFQKWQADIIPSVFPEMSQKTKSELQAKSIPAVYLRRKVVPTFLENFWFSMLNLALSFFSLGCVLLAVVYCKRRGKKNGELVLGYLLTGLINFIVVQLYYHCGDILLFFILETRSIDFGSALSVVSFCISILFLGIAICVLTLHSFILLRYTRKTSGFEEKYSHFKILYEAFKGSSFLPSSYLLLFTLRDVALNLVIALLFEHTLAQSILFICICVVFMSYLIIMRPFKKTMENIGQCFFEALVLLTYIAALLIWCADANDWDNQDRIKHRLGTGVLVMALIFGVVSTALMIFSLLRMVVHFYRDLTQRKALKKVHVVPESSQATHQNLNLTNKTNPIELDGSSRALDDSPVRSIIRREPPNAEPSFVEDLSSAERIQIKRSNEQDRANQFGRFQPDKSVIQEESEQISQSIDKLDTSRLDQNQSQSHLLNQPNSKTNTYFFENRSSRTNPSSKDPALITSRIINFATEKDLSTTENQKNEL